MQRFWNIFLWTYRYTVPLVLSRTRCASIISRNPVYIK